jgi:hypothetical protein
MVLTPTVIDRHRVDLKEDEVEWSLKQAPTSVG